MGERDESRHYREMSHHFRPALRRMRRCPTLVCAFCEQAELLHCN